MSCRRSLFLTVATLLLLPLPVLSQSLEGVIKQRTLDLENEALSDLVYAGSENEPDFDSEADWLRYVAEKLFSIPVADLAGDASDVTIHVRGTMLRYQEDSGGGYVITDLATMTTQIVDPSSRSYVEYNPAEAQAAAEEAMARMGIDPEEIEAYEMDADYGGEEDGIFSTPRVWALDRTEEVNGMTARVFQAEAGNEIGMAWCAEDAAGMRQAMEYLASQVSDTDDGEEALESQGPSVEDLLCEQGIPVRTKIFNMGYAGDLSFTVTETLSMEQTSVSRGMFEVPEGYTKKSMQEMWQ